MFLVLGLGLGIRDFEFGLSIITSTEVYINPNLSGLGV